MSKVNYTDLGVAPHVTQSSNDKKDVAVIAKYQSLHDKKSSTRLRFTTTNAKGDLILYEDGFTIIMPNSDGEGNELYPVRRKGIEVGLPHDVTVESVDVKNRLITVKSLTPVNTSHLMGSLAEKLKTQLPVTTEVKRVATETIDGKLQGEYRDYYIRQTSSHKESLRKELITEEYIRLLKERDFPFICVSAVISHVEAHFVICNILGYSVQGRISRYDWSYATQTDMRRVCKTGDVVDVCVLAWTNPETDRTDQKQKPLFMCSRLPLIENIWYNCPFEKGDYVTIRCERVTDSYWYGHMEGCEFNFCVTPPKTGRVQLAHVYQCRITHFKPELRLLRAKTLRDILY